MPRSYVLGDFTCFAIVMFLLYAGAVLGDFSCITLRAVTSP